MAMYDVPTEGCNLEIMGYPFFVESVSPNEAFRRREFNFNNIVGGTQKVTQGAYIGLDFTITTHVKIDPDRPDVHNSIFQEMMSKPVEVISPEIGGKINAVVVIKPEHDKLNYLKLTIQIKEIPDATSLIPGENENVTVPATREVKEDTESKSTSNKNTLSSVFGNRNSNKGFMSKINSIAKKSKGSE